MSLIDTAKNPLLICHALAGDLLMAVPALRAILSRYGNNLPVICGTEPEHFRVFESLGFTQIFQTEFATRDPRPGETVITPCEWKFDVAQVISRVKNCDLMINLTDSCGPAFDELARRCAIPSVGYHARADRRVIDVQSHRHMFELYFDVVRALFPDEYLCNYAYFPHRSDAAQIRAIVREQVGPHRLVVIHADTKDFKMWPIDRWANWLEQLWAAEPETRVALLGYPAIPVEHFASDERLHDCRDLPLTVNYEIAAMADQFVGIDSCMLHAADLCRIPSVGIYTRDYPPETFGFYFADSVSITGSNPPTDVSVAAVWEAYCHVRDRQWSAHK